MGIMRTLGFVFGWSELQKSNEEISQTSDYHLKWHHSYGPHILKQMASDTTPGGQCIAVYTQLHAFCGFLILLFSVFIYMSQPPNLPEYVSQAPYSTSKYPSAEQYQRRSLGKAC